MVKFLNQISYITKISFNVILVKYWPKLRFRKVTLANLKTEKLPLALATSYFQELFVKKFDLKSRWFEEKKLISEEIYHEKTVKGKNAPLPV